MRFNKTATLHAIGARPDSGSSVNQRILTSSNLLADRECRGTLFFGLSASDLDILSLANLKKPPRWCLSSAALIAVRSLPTRISEAFLRLFEPPGPSYCERVSPSMPHRKANGSTPACPSQLPSTSARLEQSSAERSAMSREFLFL